VSSWLAARGVGHTLGSSLVVGVGAGLLALAVMVGVALAIDPSLGHRVRRSRAAVVAASDVEEVAP
jgi:putative peptidoglycan lipid II flippase